MPIHELVPQICENEQTMQCMPTPTSKQGTPIQINRYPTKPHYKTKSTNLGSNRSLHTTSGQQYNHKLNKGTTYPMLINKPRGQEEIPN